MSLAFETKEIEVNGLPCKVILQNENGPCALVALTNLLVLSLKHRHMSQRLIHLLEESSIVSLEMLNQVLVDIALSNVEAGESDKAELLRLMPSLHTGMNINPKFNGLFQNEREMALFRLFDVILVHGWIMDNESRDAVEVDRLADYSYEDAQNLMVNVNSTSNLKDLEDSAFQNAKILQEFMDSSPTQLTNEGLNTLRASIEENTFAILFRNDHFSTVHVRDHTLFALVTDLGYKDCKSVVWESIQSVDGSNDEFWDSGFRLARITDDKLDMSNTYDAIEQQVRDDELLALSLQKRGSGVGARSSLERKEKIRNIDNSSSRHNLDSSTPRAKIKDAKTKKNNENSLKKPKQRTTKPKKSNDCTMS